MFVSLLRRYLQLYWLKPFDAVNDAANAWALLQFPWQEPILEVGGGDGAFSFIMHGGEFDFIADRYDQSDPRRAGDMFDVYREGRPLTVKRRASRVYAAGVDLKRSHVLKARETDLYQLLVVSPPEPLPFADQSFRTVFLYFPHGLVEQGQAVNYEEVLKEIHRVLRPDGSLFMTAFNRRVEDAFVCRPLQRFCARMGWHRASEYFRRLDGGRYEEISGLARTSEQWESLLEKSGFRFLESWTHVSPLAWRSYDFQTRPILRVLITCIQQLRPASMKRLVKIVWILLCLPPLCLFYLLFARPWRYEPEGNRRTGVLFAFRATTLESAVKS